MTLALLLLALSVGGEVTPCGNAVCVGTVGQDVNLGGTLTETRGPIPDGGLAILTPSLAGAVTVIQGIQPSGSSSTPDVIVRSRNTHTGTGSFVSFRNGANGAEVFGISPAGASGVAPSLSTGFIDAGTILVDTLRVTSLEVDQGTLRALYIDAGTVVANTNLTFGTGSAAAAGNSIYAASASILVFSTNGTAAWDIEGANKDFVPSNAGSTIGLAGANGPTGLFSAITVNGKATVAGNSGSCTLNGGTPSTCTVSVTAGAKCQCTPVGTTAVIAAGGCAVSLSSTTLTATSFATATNDVNILCDR